MKDLQFIKYQTGEICIGAIQQYDYALCHVKSQTKNICISPVLQNGLALKYVKNKNYLDDTPFDPNIFRLYSNQLKILWKQ